MAQVTIYLDEETIRKVDRAAKRARSSVSAWVKARIDDALARGWPPGYLSLLGSLKDSDLDRPPQPPRGADVTREPL